MARLTLLVLSLLLCACSSSPKPPVPPVGDLGPREGLAFPDVGGVGDRAAADRPAPSDRRAEPPRPTDARAERARDQAIVPSDAAQHDQKPAGADLSPTQMCYLDWSKWSCTASIWSFGCTASCGGTLQIKCSMLVPLCSCTKAGQTKQCATPGAGTCAPCQAAMKSGCCSF